MKVEAFRDRIAELRKELTERTISRIADLLAGVGCDVIEARLNRVIEKDGQSVMLATIEDVERVASLLVGLKSAGEIQSRLDALEASARSKRAPR
jgi:hypothetical protein